ncbi:hypothetical protein [Rhizobium sp. BK491]|uniref:hypothetical protein n=1 Tax=Rhizobium sp. BK491 TaxID=2587009 RepID=UPI0016159B43|nr:hypothetical protein [Rhizobium sp. BK491]MBB3571583.1 hypothetical protein [Rhizobium sp. BK491]
MDEEGRSIADIAARFATTETVVESRPALARLSPALLGLCRNKQMNYEQLAAFSRCGLVSVNFSSHVTCLSFLCEL